VQQHPIHHSKEAQRAARSKLVSKKQSNYHVQSQLDKKQKMLHIMEAADAKKHGFTAPEAPLSMQSSPNTATTKSSSKPSSASKSSKAKSGGASKSSVYMADPSSKQALAAERRIQQKQSKKGKSGVERKNRTRDLIFGDGLNEEVSEEGTANARKAKSAKASPNKYKSDKFVPVSSDSRTANAALARLEKQKNGKVINSKDRRERTMNLVHGDGLKNADYEVQATPREHTAYEEEDMDPEIVGVHRSIMNLNNCNDHFAMPATAKLLRKVVNNLLVAEEEEDQDKFGKLRLGNKKIKAAFVDMQYGVETLESLGFARKSIYNEKTAQMDEYMLFDFEHKNIKALLHVMELLNEYYPEV